MDVLEIKEFLRIDSNEEDELISNLKLSAEEYLSNSGVKKDYDKELYKLAVKILVGHWYENRNAVTNETSNKIDYSLNSIINQLKYQNS